MIELVYSNRTESLLQNLANYLLNHQAQETHPLEPVEMVVPNRNMETWVRLRLAQTTGIAANLRFRRLENFIGEIVARASPGEYKLINLDTVEAAILSVLLDDKILDSPDMQPIRKYLASAGHTAAFKTDSAFDIHLEADGADLRRVQLASRMAHLFQEYSFSRPEMIAAWRKNDLEKRAGRRSGSPALTNLPYVDPAKDNPALAPTVTWQRALWCAVFGENGILKKNPPEEFKRWTTLDQVAFDDSLFEKISSSGYPPVHIFGVSYVARIFQLLFARLGEAGTLRIYTLNPCKEFWEDVETDRDYSRRLGKIGRTRSIWAEAGENEEEDPFGLNVADTPALRYWGRPGREHIRLLGELTDCDFESAFDDPLEYGSGLLHHLQNDIFERKPEQFLEKCPEQISTAPYRPDETLKLTAAPSVRREVEWVADEIWRLMREDQPGSERTPLRFSDVAVIVNSAERDIYLPQIEAVFAACNNIPCSISDLPGTTGSRVVEAMKLLLRLSFSRFSRTEVLSLLSHPAIIGRFDNLTPADLADLSEKLGIVFGADHSDHEGTYIDEDVFNWDQGIRRLALGAFLTGEKSGDDRFFETERGRWLAEEVSGSSISAAARFGLLVRSLFADARFVREQQLTLSDWSRFYSVQIDAYLHSEDGTDARDRLRLLNALARLESMDLGYKVSGRVAAEIALEAIEALGGGRGQYLAEGVVVSSFLPMRAIPFRTVFVLGLGEGLFPAPAERDALDLRSARRRAGDVDPSERDRYMFLETLLCTRDKLCLSYVRRDEQTGDPLQPSAVVQELLHILQTGYLGEEGIKGLRIEPALRRYDDLPAPGETFFDEARVEKRIQEISLGLYSRLPRAGESKPAEEPGKIEKLVNPEAWKKLSAMLALPGEPPEAGFITTTTLEPGPSEEASVEAPISISMSAIRRFLECPMQGWAAAMLGLTGDEEDLMEREEEDFELGRQLETWLLREAFLDSAASGRSPAELYDKRAERLRLKGQYPVGILAQVATANHRTILKDWQYRLGSLLERVNSIDENEPVPIPLHRVRLGRSSEQSATESVLDPLVLDVVLGEAEEQHRVVPVRISGRTEGLFDDRLTSITFQPGQLSTNRNRTMRGKGFRHLLRGIIDHAVLSAVSEAGNRERRILLCHAGDPDREGFLGLKLRPLDPERARFWLKEVVTDLLNGPHAYLLPCEAAFLEYYERTRPGRNRKKANEQESDQGQDAGTPSEPAADLLRPAAASINGEKLRTLALELAEDEWSMFSSLWGPVPSPRSYEPPPASEAAGIAARRFGPLFADIIELEGF